MSKSTNTVVYFDWKTVIMSPKQSLGDILCLLHFLLLLHHPDCCRVMYCYSMFLFHYYSYSSTHFCPLDFSEMAWSNFMKPWRQLFWKNKPLKAQLHMAYDISTRFHKVWSRHLREIERIKMCGRIRIIVKKKHRIAIHHPTAVRVM
jgi:hypothetical protein